EPHLRAPPPQPGVGEHPPQPPGAGPPEPGAAAPGPPGLPRTPGEGAGADAGGAHPAAAMKVHQLLAALSYGDAISNQALAIQAPLRPAGHESDISAEGVPPRLAHLARPLWQYHAVSGPRTVCLFHFSIGSAAGRLIHRAPDRLVCIYHNITPARF